MKPNHLWEKSSILKYTDYIQQNIQRMSNASISIKRIAFSVVLVLVGISINQAKQGVAWMAFISVLLFWLLDSYYLALEKSLRDSWDNWVKTVNGGDFDANQFMVFRPRARNFIWQTLISDVNAFTYLALFSIPTLGLFLI